MWKPNISLAYLHGHHEIMAFKKQFEKHMIIFGSIVVLCL
jgi:hypothetical protein